MSSTNSSSAISREVMSYDNQVVGTLQIKGEDLVYSIKEEQSFHDKWFGSIKTFEVKPGTVLHFTVSDKPLKDKKVTVLTSSDRLVKIFIGTMNLE